MKYIFLLQVFVYSILFIPANAQVENWETYMARFGDKPGSVLVDMGLLSNAPDRRYPYLVITGPKAQNCNKQGLPDKEEINELENILSATDNFITGVTAKVLTGTLTYKCERLNYYYVKDTVGIRNAIMRLYNRGYPNYSYAINMKSDPEWGTYRTFLYPSDTMLNWIENNKIITRLLQGGDSLTQPRDIQFGLSFTSDKDMKAFAEYAKTIGYKPAFIDTRHENDTLRLVVSKYGLVRMENINSFSETLKKEVKRFNGIYNSWFAPRPPKPDEHSTGIKK